MSRRKVPENLKSKTTGTPPSHSAQNPVRGCAVRSGAASPGFCRERITTGNQKLAGNDQTHMGTKTKRFNLLITLMATTLAVGSCATTNDESQRETEIAPVEIAQTEEVPEEVSPDQLDEVGEETNPDQPYDDENDTPPIEQTLPLFGELSDDVAVMAVGTSEGTEPTDRQIGGRAAQIADVYVNEPNRPILLVLSAYDPVLWRIGKSTDTEIVGVLVSGYYGQDVVGLADDTPSFITSHEDPGNFEPAFYFDETSPELLEASKIVEELTGRAIGSFVGDAVDDTYFVGEPGPEANSSKDDEPEFAQYVDPDLEPNDPAIRKFVSEGKLRLATVEDIQAWLDKHNERYAALGTELKTLEYPNPETYVVLDEIELPYKLAGANAVSFIVPEDLPGPTGPEGHNSYYWMWDGSRTGPFS